MNLTSVDDWGPWELISDSTRWHSKIVSSCKLVDEEIRIRGGDILLWKLKKRKEYNINGKRDLIQTQTQNYLGGRRKKKKKHIIKYQNVVRRRREKRVAKLMKLISRRQKQATHVDRQQIGAVPTSDSNSFEQARTRNTHLTTKIKLG